MERIEAAKKLVLKSFTDPEMTASFTEGTIDAALSICDRNGGLYVESDMLLAFFRYFPSQAAMVENMDWYELEHANLKHGPILHVVAFIAPIKGYRLFRRSIAVLNPWGVSAHRWNKREKTWRLTAKENMGFVEVVDGEFRHWRQQ